MTSIERKHQLRDNKLYVSMQKLTVYLDKYYLDGVIGLIPGGIGDIIPALFGMTYIYFSLFKLRSVPLTLAVVNNTLRDILLGLIPFYVGDAIDFFHKSNTKNMALIDGFINDNTNIMKKVNQKALQSLLVLFALLTGIGLLIALLIMIAKSLGTILFS